MGGARARFEVECPPLATAATPKSLCCENKARVESVSTLLVPVMMMMMVIDHDDDDDYDFVSCADNCHSFSFFMIVICWL